MCKDTVSSFYSVIEKLMSFIFGLSSNGVFTMMALVLLCTYIAYVIYATLVYSGRQRLLSKILPAKYLGSGKSPTLFALHKNEMQLKILNRS